MDSSSSVVADMVLERNGGHVPTPPVEFLPHEIFALCAWVVWANDFSISMQDRKMVILTLYRLDLLPLEPPRLG